MEDYFKRSEVSNSDLTWLKKYWMESGLILEFEAAFRFGKLVDAVITEPYLVNYFKKTVLDVPYTGDEFEIAKQMKKSFMADPLCLKIFQQSEFQKISTTRMKIIYEGIPFSMEARCKWDLFMKLAGWGADIKSTAATSQKQFEEACRHFDYDRSRAWYMDIENTPKDLIIGISKINFKIFKVYLSRDSDIYRQGKQKYQELAFKWWYLFENINS